MLLLNVELDMGFYSRNFFELEKQRKIHQDKNDELLRSLEIELAQSFDEEQGWIMTSFDKYIELKKESWQEYSTRHKTNVCLEVGFFDCGGSKCLHLDDVKVSVSSILMTTVSKHDITCDFVSRPKQSIANIISKLKALDDKISSRL